MEEQLELFSDNDLPLTREEKEPCLPGNHDVPEGYVKVRVGPDEGLRQRGHDIAMRLGLPKLAAQVEVEWNRKMRTSAGRAFYQMGKIELNPRLQALPVETRDDEIERTFLHELAHLVSFARAQGKRIQPHGPEWKQACADVGIPGEDRCHDLNFAPRKMRRKFAYECPACGSVVERVRRLKRRVACFDCCRARAGGKFDARFVLEEKPIC
ncbi:MAG: SprT-like domain-containing protein [Verrucomicrobiales bacterium]|nr:SprT-like domain-containing protein [Verrucomicrobiales bacterium]